MINSASEDAVRLWSLEETDESLKHPFTIVSGIPDGALADIRTSYSFHGEENDC